MATIGADVQGPNGSPARFFGYDRRTGQAILGIMEKGEVVDEVRLSKEEFLKLNPSFQDEEES